MDPLKLNITAFVAAAQEAISKRISSSPERRFAAPQLDKKWVLLFAGFDWLEEKAHRPKSKTHNEILSFQQQ